MTDSDGEDRNVITVDVTTRGNPELVFVDERSSNSPSEVPSPEPSVVPIMTAPPLDDSQSPSAIPSASPNQIFGSISGMVKEEIDNDDIGEANCHNGD